MKKLVQAIAALALVAFLASCGSAPAPKPEPAPEPTKAPVKVAAPKPDIVNHKGYVWNSPVPEWVSSDISELEAMPKYKDFYVYVAEATGKSLDGAMLAAKNFNGLAPFAQNIKTRVQNLFVGAQAGDQDKIETYMENIVKTMADAEFSGFRQVTDYWVEMKYPDREETVFAVKILYTIERAQVKKLIEAKLDEQKEDTPDKKETKDKVKKLIEGSLPALDQ